MSARAFPAAYRLLLAAALAVPHAGCLVTTTPPPVDPGLGSLPAGNIAAREGIVVAQLRTIKKAEDLHFAKHGSYATAEELVEAGLLAHAPTAGGYTIELTVTDDGYVVEAVPDEYGPDGRRSFYLDERGVVRGDDHEGGAPEPTDPPV